MLSHTETPQLVVSHDQSISNPIPLILVHGDGNDSELDSYYKWQTLIDYVKNNAYNFRFFDIWVWRNDTELPIGFNGYTGNAKELSGYIYNDILSNPIYSQGTKVLFVSHSRGGLVCRSFMNYNNQGDDVLGLITLGTPHHGSPFAVPDWSAILWGYYVGTDETDRLAYNLLVGKSGLGFDIDRMGSLNLTWDNMDSAIAGLTSLNFGVSFSINNNVFLTTRDQNEISTYSDETILFADRYKSNFGTMAELNQTTAYLNKITAYAAYDNDLSDNPDWADFSDIIKNLAKSYFSDHYGLSAITMLQAFSSENISSNNSVYYANDGMVPLQSALLLDISNGTPFCTMEISEKISLLNNNIALKKQVFKQRIFSNEDGIIDHLHLLDAPLQSSYWATLQEDILSYIGTTGLAMADMEIPETFILEQNYPNPFNPSTQIRFGLPKSSKVFLEIYNAVGQNIITLINSEKTAGYYTINFDGSHLASGTYYYRLNADNFQQVRKMIIVK